MNLWLIFGAVLITQAVVLRAIGKAERHTTEHFDRITHHLERFIMAAVQVDQTVLDSIGTELGSIADAVQALVDNPDVPLAAGDLSGITDAVSRIEASLTTPEKPVAPEPEPAPEA